VLDLTKEPHPFIKSSNESGAPSGCLRCDGDGCEWCDYGYALDRDPPHPPEELDYLLRDGQLPHLQELYIVGLHIDVDLDLLASTLSNLRSTAREHGQTLKTYLGDAARPNRLKSAVEWMREGLWGPAKGLDPDDVVILTGKHDRGMGVHT